MIKYNRDKRGTYNARIRKSHTYDRCDRCDRHIHIKIRYDKQDASIYIPVIYKKVKDTHEQRYVGMMNAINDIFPEINKPHTAHIYRAMAAYHKYIPQETYHTRPEPEPDVIDENTRTAKCIIMNDKDEIIYIGKIRRTRTVNKTKGTIDITLHRGTRTMKAYERAINLDRIIHNMTIREIKAHDVEIYYI